VDRRVGELARFGATRRALREAMFRADARRVGLHTPRNTGWQCDGDSCLVARSSGPGSMMVTTAHAASVSSYRPRSLPGRSVRHRPDPPQRPRSCSVSCDDLWRTACSDRVSFLSRHPGVYGTSTNLVSPLRIRSHGCAWFGQPLVLRSRSLAGECVVAFPARPPRLARCSPSQRPASPYSGNNSPPTPGFDAPVTGASTVSGSAPQRPRSRASSR